MAYGLFAMQTIQVQDVDFCAGKSFQGVIEPAAKQGRKTLIIPGIVGGDIFEDCLFIKTGLRIAFPGINGKAACASFVFDDGLAESKVTFPAVGSQFDKQAGSLLRHQVVAKIEMFRPGANAVDTRLEFLRWQVRNRFRLHKARRHDSAARQKSQCESLARLALRLDFTS
jgi:hypothetical protein